MGDLTLDEVKDIGVAAIRRVIGDTFATVATKSGSDFEGRVAYFFTISFSTEDAWWRASALQAEMARAIIDGLDLRGDEHFPFIRIITDGSWTLTRNVAAE